MATVIGFACNTADPYREETLSSAELLEDMLEISQRRGFSRSKFLIRGLPETTSEMLLI
jgi:hypothetical protein